VVICAIALSLAYPVREYIAQRRQIDQLVAERQMTLAQLRTLQRQQQRLNDPAYIEQLARDKLHFCMTGQTCYVIIGGPGSGAAAAARAAGTPWYDRLWHSVQQADGGKPAGHAGPAAGGSGR
jgi:cell division protein FtsL